jgi:hypothetical protein
MIPVRCLGTMPPVFIKRMRSLVKPAARFVAYVNVKPLHADVLLGKSFAERREVF